MFQRVLVAVCAILMFATCSAIANDFHKPNVEELTSKNFEEKINDGGVWFVKMYAPWCGHCKRLAGTWGELGDAFKSNEKVHVAHVDCTTDKAVCDKFEVRGYPTLKLLSGGSEFKAYSGARDLDTLKSWLTEQSKAALSETTA